VIPVDALGYMAVAESFQKGAAYPNPREIGYPLLLFILFFWGEISFLKLRILTLLFGVLNMYLIYKVALRITDYYNLKVNGNDVGIFSSLLLATSHLAVMIDNLGVRETIALTILLAIVHEIYTRENRYGPYKIFVLYFLLSIMRSEFQFTAVLFSLVFVLESYQHGENSLRRSGIAILVAGILGLITWSLLSLLLLGDPSVTSKMLVANIIRRNNQGGETGSLLWYVFEYKGIPGFIFTEAMGFVGIVLLVALYLNFDAFILLIFGVSTIRSSHRYTLLTIYVIGALINGFNAFEWKFIGTDRIMLPYYSFLWIISAFALTKAGDARIQVSSDRIITIPK